MAKIKTSFTQEEMDQLCENILCDIDYDIYKEDMEEGELRAGIEARIKGFLENVDIVWED